MCMASNRWKKYAKANVYILDILKDGKPMTTWQIREQLRKKCGFFLHHTTTKKYLEELRKQGHIEKLKVNNEKNEVGTWIRR